MSKLLADAGFEVTAVSDLSQKEMNDKVGDFAAKLSDTHHVSMHASQGDGFRKGSTHLAHGYAYGRRHLIESHADLIVVAPDRMAVAREMVAVDVKRELRRQSGRICDVEARAARRDVPHRAVDDDAIVKRQPSALEDAMPRMRAPLVCMLVHGRHSHQLQALANEPSGRRLRVDKL
jgi:hypothetical protein